MLTKFHIYSKIQSMVKNLSIGIGVILLIALGGYLFVSQSRQNKPLPTGEVTFPKAQTQSPPAQSPTPLPTQQVQQSGTQSGNMVTTMPDGLKIQDITVGSGREAKLGDTVTVNYVGKLQTGQVFDSSYDRDQPFTTQIGVGQVIKGWDEGIPGMKVGGKRVLVIPAELGYGNQQAGPIPPNSTLIFQVELLDVK